MVKFIVRLIALPFPKHLWQRVRHALVNLIFSIPVRMRAERIGTGLVCFGFSKVSRQTSIGDDVSLNDLKVEGGGSCRIGNHVRTGREILILTANHDYKSDLLPFGTEYINKDVEIGDCVWIGTKVIILPGTKIGEGCVIQAGSVVHGVIPPCSVVGGNPAKVFSMRDAKLYARLKAENRFYLANGKTA